MTKYYKILNEKECHHGLQYKTGLNIDPNKFRIPDNYFDNCQSGGIYFSDVQNIFRYINFGPYIREVIIPKDAKTYKTFCNTKLKADKIHLKSRQNWCSLKVIKKLQREGADIHIENDHVFKYAIRNGHVNIVKYLVSQGANINDCDDALICASRNGHLKVVKYLVSQGVNIGYWCDFCLKYAKTEEIINFLRSKI